MESAIGTRVDGRIRPCAFLLAAAGIVLAGAATAQTKTIKIGVMMSLTGAASTLGQSQALAVDMAIKEMNAAGGILGRQIALVEADDQTDPTIAVNEARRLVQQEKAEAMVGPSLSNLAVAVAQIYTDAKIPSILGAAAPQLTPQFVPYSFSGVYTADTQGHAMATYVAQGLKAKSAAILADNAGNSKAVVEGATDGLTAYGVRVTGTQQFEYHATDMTPQLLSLRRTEPEVLLVHGVGAEDMGYVLKGLADIGWNVRVAGSAAFGAYAPSILKIAGPDAFKNSWGLEVKAATYCASDPVGQSPYAQFIARLKAFDPERAAKVTPGLAAADYGALYFLKAGIEGAGSTEGPKFAAWVEANAGTVQGIFAPYAANKESHFLIGADGLVPVQDFTKRSDGLLHRAGC